jgi:hypothetical protein
LRTAHAYILISIPTGTSMILGAFQAITNSNAAQRRRLDKASAGQKVRQTGTINSFVIGAKVE